MEGERRRRRARQLIIQTHLPLRVPATSLPTVSKATIEHVDTKLEETLDKDVS